MSLAASTQALITLGSPELPVQPVFSGVPSLTGASSADISLAHVRFVDSEIVEATNGGSILTRIFALNE